MDIVSGVNCLKYFAGQPMLVAQQAILYRLVSNTGTGTRIERASRACVPAWVPVRERDIISQSVTSDRISTSSVELGHFGQRVVPCINLVGFVRLSKLSDSVQSVLSLCVALVPFCWHSQRSLCVRIRVCDSDYCCKLLYLHSAIIRSAIINFHWLDSTRLEVVNPPRRVML